MYQNPQIDCSLCLTLIHPNNEIAAANPKCAECLRKMNSIPSGFPFKLLVKVAEYECPICLALIKDATVLPCTHLMCRACLDYYENSQIEAHGS